MNVTITFKNKVESYYTRADGSAALSKDVLELTADGSADTGLTMRTQGLNVDSVHFSAE